MNLQRLASFFFVVAVIMLRGYLKGMILSAAFIAAEIVRLFVDLPNPVLSIAARLIR